LIIIILFGLFVFLFIFLNPGSFVLFYFFFRPLIDWFASKGVESEGLYLSPQYLLGVITPIGAFSFLLIKKIRLSYLPLGVPILIFLLANIISFIFTPGTFFSKIGLFLRLFGPLVIYYFIPVVINSFKKIMEWAKLIVFSVSFPIFFSILQLFHKIPYHRYAYIQGLDVRLDAGYGDAFFLTMHLIAGLYFILFVIYTGQEINRNRRFCYFILFATVFFLLLKTYYRTSYIIFAVSIILWFYITGNKKALMASLILFAISFLAFSMFFSHFFADLFSFFKPEQGLNFEQSFHGRAGRWADMMVAFNKADFYAKLIGISYNFSRYSHNDFIRSLFNTGILGLISYLFLIYSIIVQIIKRFFFIRNGYLKGNFFIGLVALSAIYFMSYFLTSFTLNPSTLIPLSYPMWSVLGITFSQVKIKRYHGKNRMLQSRCKFG